MLQRKRSARLLPYLAITRHCAAFIALCSIHVNEQHYAYVGYFNLQALKHNIGRQSTLSRKAVSIAHTRTSHLSCKCTSGMLLPLLLQPLLPLSHIAFPTDLLANFLLWFCRPFWRPHSSLLSRLSASSWCLRRNQLAFLKFELGNGSSAERCWADFKPH